MDGELQCNTEIEGKTEGGRIPYDIQQQARQKESPVISKLLVAARKGYTEQVLQLLHEDKKQAAIIDKHGRTCLHLACINGHLETVLAILQSRALPIDVMTKRGHTALHESCQEGHIHLSLLLISLGANLHTHSREGWTPLMCACSRGHMQLAHILAAAGSNVNDTTRLGLTPLHIAAWKGHTEVVKLLLSLGCNPATVAHNNKTAQQLAGEEEHKETVTVLQAATAKVSQEPAYHISSLEGQLRLCQEKLTEAFTHHNQVLAAERHHWDERERSLKNELEEEKAKVAAILVMQADGRHSKGATKVISTDDEEVLALPKQEAVLSGTIAKSASSSDLIVKQCVTAPSSQHNGDRLTITDIVSECLQNPSSMANIRSNLKADNLTPRIQRKFRYKRTSASLPSMNNVTSPLAHDGVRAKETARSLGSSSTACSSDK